MEASSYGRRDRVSSQSFVVLLALARKPLTNGELGSALGANPAELGHLIDRLRRNGLVDPVNELGEVGASQALRLTNKGERVLLSEMEQMCELPER